jgi:hypothetical protein
MVYVYSMSRVEERSKGMAYKRYRGARDPYWLESRYAGSCAKCGATIVPGERIFYYPNDRKAYSGSCAEAAAGDFAACAADERQYTGGY